MQVEMNPTFWHKWGTSEEQKFLKACALKCKAVGK